MTSTSALLSRRGLMALGAALAGAALADRCGAKAPSEKLFDAHAHLVSSDLKRYPQISNPFPPLHFRQMGTARPLPEAEAMIGWMKENGVESMAAVQKRGSYGFDNSYILDSSVAHPKSFFPIVILDAQDDATPGAISQLVTRGLAGVRLTGVMAPDGSFPWLASEKALRLWSVAAQSGLPIEVMTLPFGNPPATIPVFADLARKFPNVPIVVDHLNWPDARGAPDFGIEALARALAPCRNVLFKFTTINMDVLYDAGLSPAAFLENAVRIFGPERIMWGTDVGNTPGTYAELVERGRSAAATLPPKARHAVLYGTGHGLFAKRGFRA